MKATGTRTSRGDSPAARVRRLLEEHAGERHAVVIQDYPDPDALSSALAHRMIAARFEIQADILYAGTISHQENLALVRLLELELVRCGEKTSLADYRHSVFIDNQGTTTSLLGRLEEAGVKPLLVVDHHEPQQVLEPVLSDIRTVGATATIYTEYLREGLLELDASKASHIRLATALMHGLRSETHGLVRARAEELEAAAYLGRFYDPEMLEDILGVRRTRRTMEGIRHALSSRVIVEGYSVAGLGYLGHRDRDIIPQVADFLLTEENVHTAICYGVVVAEEGTETVVGSLRSVNLTVDPDDFLKQALGTDATGRAYGGGRREAGGFEIPVGFFSGMLDEEYEQMKWQLIDKVVRQKILDRIARRT